MQITCPNCGSDRFKAGYFEPNPDGGVDVLMPCAQCGQPLKAMTEDDPDMVASLIGFFAPAVET